MPLPYFSKQSCFNFSHMCIYKIQSAFKHLFCGFTFLHTVLMFTYYTHTHTHTHTHVPPSLTEVITRDKSAQTSYGGNSTKLMSSKDISFGSRHALAASSCEHGNESYLVSDYQLHNKDCAQWRCWLAASIYCATNGFGKKIYKNLLMQKLTLVADRHESKLNSCGISCRSPVSNSQKLHSTQSFPEKNIKWYHGYGVKNFGSP
jgi:hypothetical protein